MSAVAEGQGTAPAEGEGQPDPIQQAITTLTAAGHKVYTEADLNTLLDTTRQEHETAVINPRVSKIYQDLDADILAKSKVPKIPGEKTYDYNKRVMDAYNARVTALEGATPELETLRTEYETKLTDKEKWATKTVASAKFQAVVNGLEIAVPAHLTGDDATAYKTQQRELMLTVAQSLPHRVDAEGNLIFQTPSADGSLVDQVNVSDNKPVSAEKVLGDRFKLLLAKPEPVVNGTGARAAAANMGNKVPANKKDLTTILVDEKGFTQGSKVFNEAYEKELKITD